MRCKVTFDASTLKRWIIQTPAVIGNANRAPVFMDKPGPSVFRPIPDKRLDFGVDRHYSIAPGVRLEATGDCPVRSVNSKWRKFQHFTNAQAGVNKDEYGSCRLVVLGCLLDFPDLDVGERILLSLPGLGYFKRLRIVCRDDVIVYGDVQLNYRQGLCF